jgi:hypothetical protein
MRKIYLEIRELNYLSLKYEKIYFMLIVECLFYELMKLIFPEILDVIHSKIMMNI